LLICSYLKGNEMGRACGMYWCRGKAHIGILRGNLRERDHLGDPGVDGRIILRWKFRKWDVWVWAGSSWIRIGTVGEHF